MQATRARNPSPPPLPVPVHARCLVIVVARSTCIRRGPRPELGFTRERARDDTQRGDAHRREGLRVDQGVSRGRERRHFVGARHFSDVAKHALARCRRRGKAGPSARSPCALAGEDKVPLIEIPCAEPSVLRDGVEAVVVLLRRVTQRPVECNRRNPGIVPLAARYRNLVHPCPRDDEVILPSRYQKLVVRRPRGAQHGTIMAAEAIEQLLGREVKNAAMTVVAAQGHQLAVSRKIDVVHRALGDQPPRRGIVFCRLGM
mmetsp:Transcript_18458/g.46599  ORF Transcript_18458/g.46599 Transcript_18458/m.46599 type:complete len:259 (+) Transcript_18458:39-815(+)